MARYADCLRTTATNLEKFLIRALYDWISLFQKHVDGVTSRFISIPGKFLVLLACLQERETQKLTHA